MKKRIAIYTDEGANDFCVLSTKAFFSGHNLRLLNAADIPDALEDCDVFVMPGGADLPYCRKLNGPKNDAIRQFVENGGCYVGICAGAYYASREIAYHKGRGDEITGARELAFIDALAYGSLPKLAPYYDDTLKTATWVNLRGTDEQIYQSFYYGGCAFDLNDPDATILARYMDLPEQPPAIIEKTVGTGRVILSGVHFETDIVALTHHSEKKLATALIAAADKERLIMPWIKEKIV